MSLLFAAALLAGGVDALASPKQPPMKYTKLGDSDLEVSKVCLGTMTWGEQNTVEEGVSQLNKAFDEYGINFLDTAEMYPVPTKPETQGATDKVVAEWLRRRGKRDDVILATKVAGASERMTWLRKSGEGTRVSKKDILESVESSLKRLGTDYIDLLQIHWPDRYVPLFGEDAYDPSKERDDTISFEEQLDAFRILVEEGKVRHIGVSNETPYGVMKFTELAEQSKRTQPLASLRWPKIASIQNSYSLLVRSDFESGLSEVCSPRHCNVGLLAYSPLAGGILSGKYSDSYGGGGSVEAARLNIFPGFMERYKKSIAQEAVAAYIDVAAKHGLTPTQLSLAWCYSRPWVASTIIGATTVEQLEQNIQTFHLEFTDEMNSDINDIYKRYRDPSKI